MLHVARLLALMCIAAQGSAAASPLCSAALEHIRPQCCLRVSACRSAMIITPELCLVGKRASLLTLQQRMLPAPQSEFVGAGFMIGSAFAVVLPEGFEALYSGATFEMHDHGSDGAHDHAHAHGTGHAHPHVHGSFRRRRLLAAETVRAPLLDPESHGDWFGHEDRSGHPSGHGELVLPCRPWLPGGVLLAGFLCMMLFEFVHHHAEARGGSGHAHVHAHGHGRGCSHGSAHDNLLVRSVTAGVNLQACLAAR